MSSDNHYLVTILDEIKHLRQDLKELRQEIKDNKVQTDIIALDTQFRIEQCLCLNDKRSSKSIQKDKKEVKAIKTNVSTNIKKTKKVAINHWFSNMYVNDKGLIKDLYTDEDVKKANAIYEEEIKNKPPKKSKGQCREKIIAKIIWGQILDNDRKSKLKTFKCNWENEQAKKKNKDIVENVN